MMTRCTEKKTINKITALDLIYQAKALATITAAV